PLSTHFPYTTLFRSLGRRSADDLADHGKRINFSLAAELRPFELFAAAFEARGPRRPYIRVTVLAALHDELLLRRRVPEGLRFACNLRQRLCEICFSHD